MLVEHRPGLHSVVLSVSGLRRRGTPPECCSREVKYENVEFKGQMLRPFSGQGSRLSPVRLYMKHARCT